jgi:hypothetical protein
MLWNMCSSHSASAALSRTRILGQQGCFQPEVQDSQLSITMQDHIIPRQTVKQIDECIRI